MAFFISHLITVQAWQRSDCRLYGHYKTVMTENLIAAQDLSQYCAWRFENTKFTLTKSSTYFRTIKEKKNIQCDDFLQTLLWHWWTGMHVRGRLSWQLISFHYQANQTRMAAKQIIYYPGKVMILSIHFTKMLAQLNRPKVCLSMQLQSLSLSCWPKVAPYFCPYNGI